jgi:cob(I)alamin adenosyltransferase
MKIYTKTGDAGETSLFGGRRISKANIRIESYGVVDELNAQLGVVLLYSTDKEIGARLREIQAELFNLGADLATPLDVQSDYVIRMTSAEVQRLEDDIDRFSQELPPLKSFILPGGTESAAFLHLARTICRRAERAVVRLADVEAINPTALIYLNRLSDWLFVAARLVNHRQGQEDVPWVSPRQSPSAPDSSGT